MTLKATELYVLYADQINCLLRNKSTMWSIGFKNGLLSSRGLECKDPFLANFAADYDIGFNEGVSYAIYKSSTHADKPNVQAVSC
jgi:hypothetical protein